jgi:hypothetical protein
LHFFRQTMRARRSKFKPYSKILAIQRLILETFAMVGSFSKRAALLQDEICSKRENAMNDRQKSHCLSRRFIEVGVRSVNHD